MEYLSDGAVDVLWERRANSAVWQPDAVSLGDYSGTYFSEELDAIWRLVVRDKQLVLWRAGREDGPLLPVQLDVFSRHFGLWDDPLIAGFKFARDAAGRITHFSITTPPHDDVVRDLQFVRVRER